jgi:TnsA endonuclease N terminal
VRPLTVDAREDAVPVRKIPKNYLVTTGRIARGPDQQPAGWEGPLEQDYLILLHDDPAVESFEEQPVRVPLPKGRPYTPDVLVRFHPDEHGGCRPPELTEVKHSTHFKKYEQKLAARFAAAAAFAEERGWIFVKKDESHIRTPRLQVAYFLRAYRRHTPTAEQRDRLLQALRDLGGRSTSEQLLASITSEEGDLQALAPSLWSLVRSNAIAMDREAPLSSDVPLWLPGNAE